MRRGASCMEGKEWCCLFEGGFVTPCGTCPLPKVAQDYFVQMRYSSSADWHEGFRRDQRRNANRFSSSKGYAPGMIGTDSAVQAMSTLGLRGTVTRREVKAAFRQAALRLHPDKESGSEQAFVRLVAAYECLMRTVKR